MVICLSATTATNAPCNTDSPIRVLAILGSPRPRGISAQLLDAFLTNLEQTLTRQLSDRTAAAGIGVSARSAEQDIPLGDTSSPAREIPDPEGLLTLEAAYPASVLEITRLSCYERRPIPCDDCRYCQRQEGCSKRDLDDVYAALEAADLVVIATPVYHLSFPAPLKAFIDRLQQYWSARFVRNKRPPIARPKKLVLLTVSGSPRREGGPFLERQLAPPCTVIHASLCGAVHVIGADAPDFSPQEGLEQAAQLAGQLTDQLRPV